MSNNTFQISKRKIAAVAAAAAVFAAVTVSAATLGGVQTDSVGANSNEVAAPVTKGVSLSWDTAYDAKEAAYVVDGIELTALDANESIPATAEVKVTITGVKDTVLGEYTSTTGAKGFSVPTAPIPAHDVEGVSVVINGGAVQKIVSETN
ncbi:MAG: hypothetical protein ACTHWA_12450 [Arachnia sp.]